MLTRYIDQFEAYTLIEVRYMLESLGLDVYDRGDEVDDRISEYSINTWRQKYALVVDHPRKNASYVYYPTTFTWQPCNGKRGFYSSKGPFDFAERFLEVHIPPDYRFAHSKLPTAEARKMFDAEIFKLLGAPFRYADERTVEVSDRDGAPYLYDCVGRGYTKIDDNGYRFQRSPLTTFLRKHIRPGHFDFEPPRREEMERIERERRKRWG